MEENEMEPFSNLKIKSSALKFCKADVRLDKNPFDSR